MWAAGGGKNMYHCRLRIAVFDENPALAEMVRQIDPLERFEHGVERRSAKELAAAEIVKFSKLLQRSLQKSKRRIKKLLDEYKWK